MSALYVLNMACTCAHLNLKMHTQLHVGLLTHTFIKHHSVPEGQIFWKTDTSCTTLQNDYWKTKDRYKTSPEVLLCLVNIIVYYNVTTIAIEGA